MAIESGIGIAIESVLLNIEQNMRDAPTLLILAAGMGSRYGGLKQLDPVGPSGETVLDYAVYDGKKAGFARVVFVIRREIETVFRETIGRRYKGRIPIDFAFQDLQDVPHGFTVPANRTKPWGTAHAVRAARHLISGPFAVINADDFYGADAFLRIATYFATCRAQDKDPLCMVGYPLDHTLSENGTVNRGICQGEASQLLSVREITSIERQPDAVIRGRAQNGETVDLPPDSLVSMNFWGFSGSHYQDLEAAFIHFMATEGNHLTSEFYIPSFVDHLIKDKGQRCELLMTSADWFGVTYPDDKPLAERRLRQLVKSGAYPSPLHA